MPPTSPRAALAALLLLCAVPSGASAAVMLPPAEGLVATAGEELVTPDGLRLAPRRDGDATLVRGEEVAVHERRSGGQLVGLGVRMNKIDALAIRRPTAGGPLLLELNGAEWNPQPNQPYVLPNFGTIQTGGRDDVEAIPGVPPVARVTEIVSSRGDRLEIGYDAGRLSLRFTAGPTRLDAELDGLLRVDAGGATADDLVGPDGEALDAAGARAAWALDGDRSLVEGRTTTCAATLADPSGASWTLNPANGPDGPDQGTAPDPSFDGDATSDTNLAGGSFLRPSDLAELQGGPSSCSAEMGGRELAVPLATGRVFPPTVQGVDVTHKTAVLGGDVPAVRHLLVLRNRGGSAVDVPVLERFEAGYNSIVQATSSGAASVSAADSWAATAPGRSTFYDTGFGASGVVWQDALTRADGADAVFDLGDLAAGDDPFTSTPDPFEDGDLRLGVGFRDVRLAPYEQATLLTAHVLDDSRFDAARRAAELAAAPDALFAGLTERERRGLRNWRPVGDRDADGRDDLADACPAVPAPTADGCPAPPSSPAPAGPTTVAVPGPTVTVPGPPAPKVAPRGVRVRAKRSGRRAERLAVTGSVLRPRARPALRCGGYVEVVARARGVRGVVRRFAPVTRACRFASSARLPPAWRRRAVTVSVRFAGDDALRARRAPVVRLAPRR